MRVLVDTNIWLDILQNRPEFYQDSALALTLLEGAEHSVLLGATTITTIHYLLSKHAAKPQRNSVIQGLIERYQIAPVDEVVIRAALRLGWSDFEDAVLYAAGLQSDAEVVLTRDVKGFSGAALPVYTPSELVNILSTVDEP